MNAVEQNMPVMKIGVVTVNRDCFEIAVARKRREAMIQACAGTNYYFCE